MKVAAGSEIIIRTGKAQVHFTLYCYLCSELEETGKASRLCILYWMWQEPVLTGFWITSERFLTLYKAYENLKAAE